MKLGEIEFNSHLTHNPHCDIVVQQISMDVQLTYYIELRTGKQGCEYYRGENYVVNSPLKSFSRQWPENKIPAKYKYAWGNLKKVYETKYKI